MSLELPPILKFSYNFHVTIHYSRSESPSTSREALQPISVSHEDDSDFEVEDELPNLDAILSAHVLKKLKPKEKKRQEVINGRSGLKQTHYHLHKFPRKLRCGQENI
jgi:hypothetical protein